MKLFAVFGNDIIFQLKFWNSVNNFQQLSKKDINERIKFFLKLAVNGSCTWLTQNGIKHWNFDWQIFWRAYKSLLDCKIIELATYCTYLIENYAIGM